MAVTVEDEGARADRAELRADWSESRYRTTWYRRLIVGLYVVLAPTMAIGFSAYNTRRSEQVWCDVVNTLNEAYVSPDPGSPPLTPRGRQIAEGIARVRHAYGCDR